MKNYEKEFLLALADLEAETAEKLKKAYEKAAKKLGSAIRMLSLSELMERLQAEIKADEMGLASGKVHQKQYSDEISRAVAEPIQELEEEERQIIEESLWMYFVIGAMGAIYSMHKQNVPVMIPIQTKRQQASSLIPGELKVVFSGPQVADWYKYVRKSFSNLQVQTVADIKRYIGQGIPYSQIARSMAETMQKAPGSSFNKAYSKAMTIVRTEGGRISNEAHYSAMLEAKEKGADIKKQWDATADSRTRPSHARIDGEIRELEEPFSNGLLYPCQAGGAAEEVINCRCQAFARASWNIGKEDLQRMQYKAAIWGLDKTKNFDEFKEKYLKIAD